MQTELGGNANPDKLFPGQSEATGAARNVGQIATAGMLGPLLSRTGPGRTLAGIGGETAASFVPQDLASAAALAAPVVGGLALKGSKALAENPSLRRLVTEEAGSIGKAPKGDAEGAFPFGPRGNPANDVAPVADEELRAFKPQASMDANGNIIPAREPAPKSVESGYPRAGSEVSGLEVGKDVKNTSSISASFGDDYHELPGIREIPIEDFPGRNVKDMFYAADDHRRVRSLAEQIRQSGRIDPLIVAIDKEGPYVLEGGHRLAALDQLGVKSVPAMVVEEPGAKYPIRAARLPAPAPATPPVGTAEPLTSGAPAGAGTESDLERQMRESLELLKADPAVAKDAFNQSAEKIVAAQQAQTAAKSAEYATATNLSKRAAEMAGGDPASFRKKAVRFVSDALERVVKEEEGGTTNAVLSNIASLPGELIALKSTLSPPALRQGKVRLMTAPLAWARELKMSGAALKSETAARDFNEAMRADEWVRSTGGAYKDGQWVKSGDAIASPTMASDYSKVSSVDQFGQNIATNQGYTWQDTGGTILDWGDGVEAAKRVEDRVVQGNTEIGSAIRNSPWIKPFDRQAVIELNAHRTNWYKSVASNMWQAGERDPEEYIKLRKFIEGATHRGEVPEAIRKLPLWFSAGAQSGRAHFLWDLGTNVPKALVTGGAFRPGVEQEALKALVGMVGANMAQMAALTAIAGGAMETTTGLPTWRKGAFHWDPWAGWNSQAKLIVGIAKDIASEGDFAKGNGWENVPQDIAQKTGGRLVKFAGKGLSPFYSTVVATATGKDYRGQPYNLADQAKSGNLAADWTAPFVVQEVVNAFKEGGPVAAAADLVPSAFSEGTNTYTSQTDLRKDMAQKQYGKSFDNLGYGERQKVDAAIKANGNAYPPSEEQKAAETVKTGQKDELATFEKAMKAGENTQRYADFVHDLGQRRFGSGELRSAYLEEQGVKATSDFGKRFSGLLDSYRNLEVKNADGTTDWETTKKAQDAYVSGLSDRQQGDKPSDKSLFQGYLDYAESQKSPQEQRLVNYNKTREAAGYFEPKADTAALDRSHPNLDVEGWYLNAVGNGKRADGTVGPAAPKLNSIAAVDQALKVVEDEGLKNRPVAVAGIPRPVNQDAKSLEAWGESKAIITAYLGAPAKYEEQERARLAKQDPKYDKPLDKLDPTLRGVIHGNISEGLRKGDPELDAWMAWWGVGEKADGTVNVKSGQAYTIFKQIKAKYGDAPIKEQP